MQTIWLNNVKWYVVRVEPTSSALVDRTGRLTVGTTDPKSRLICLSKDLKGDDLARVAVHEIAHATMVSFGLLDDIARWARPETSIEAEEWCCNFMADYGMTVFRTAYALVGPMAWDVLPSELGRAARMMVK